MDVLWGLINIWMVFLFLGGLTYLFLPNPLFTAIMQMIVGILAANFVIIAVNNFQLDVLGPLAGGAWVNIIWILVGLLMFSTFFEKWRWLARYPTAVISGAGLGLVLRSILWADVLNQIRGSMVAFTGDLYTDFSNIWFVFVLAISIFYFMYGFEHKGIFAPISRVARVVVMGGIGAQAGYRFYSSSILLVTQTVLMKFWIDDAIIAFTT
jgi:hypothetical protein